MNIYVIFSCNNIINVHVSYTCRDWYKHDVPSKLLIDGESLYLSFYKEADFSPSIMNAIMRLYQELDDEMYQGCYEKRGHYLTSEWVV